MTTQTTTGKAPSRRKRAAVEGGDEQTLTIRYELAELPSAQHRAGLAGLVLMARWLTRQPDAATGIFEVTDVGSGGATLTCDQAGVKRLFNHLYAALVEEKPSATPWKGKDPKREEVREEKDDKGKVKSKKFYIYDVVIPKGGMLIELAPQQDDQGPWMKLWRDMVWNILRGVPATREPFDARAEKRATSDAEEAWQVLRQPIQHTVDLPSTYYLGAQAATAENVPFKDRGRYQFLLHFWPYVAQIYVPRVLVNQQEGRADFRGYALAIPDVADLKLFCDALPEVLSHRSAKKAGYRPEEAVIDLALEGALDLSYRLREHLHERLGAIEGAKATQDLILGIEVLHVDKEGNSVRLLSAGRIEPEDRMISEYAQCKDLRDPVFRHQRLLNLIARRAWYSGFDRLAQTLSYKKHFIGSGWFCRDARVTFEQRRNHEVHMSEQEDKEREAEATPKSLEDLLFRVVQSYVMSKLKNKYGLSFDKSKMIEKSQELKQYQDAKEKVARDAFLAVRARTADDFVDYFSGSLCSVRQPLNRQDFVTLAQALKERPDEVRTLTLLALSANS